MKYMGSKARIAKHILPIILKDRKPDQLYYEPFTGGANLIDKVTGRRIGSDNNIYLISLLNALSNGWEPPREVSKEYFLEVKNNKDKYPISNNTQSITHRRHLRFISNCHIR